MLPARSTDCCRKNGTTHPLGRGADHDTFPHPPPQLAEDGGNVPWRLQIFPPCRLMTKQILRTPSPHSFLAPCSDFREAYAGPVAEHIQALGPGFPLNGLVMKSDS